MIGEKPQSSRKTYIGVGIVIVLLAVAGYGIYEATRPPPTTPTPTPIPAIWKEKGKGAVLIIKVKNDTDNQPYRTRVDWEECNEYDFTVEIEVEFNGSDCILIRRVDAVLKPIEERKTSSKTDVMFCVSNVTLSYEFEFSFHPQELVKIPTAFELVIEIHMDEFFQGKWEYLELEERIVITIHPWAMASRTVSSSNASAVSLI